MNNERYDEATHMSNSNSLKYHLRTGKERKILPAPFSAGLRKPIIRGREAIIERVMLDDRRGKNPYRALEDLLFQR